MNNLEKSNMKEIEDLLTERKNKEALIEKQEKKLMELKSHKRTIVSALCGNKTFYFYPRGIKYGKQEECIYINDEFPFYILNIGEIVDLGDGNYYRNNYKMVRKFVAHKNSRSSHPNIFYTTSVMIKNNNEKWFIITDDENNLIHGRDIFQSFKGWFDFELPFNTIEDWLGFTSDNFYSKIRAMGLTV